MNILDFIDLCVDASMLTISIWDSDVDKIVWTGPADEVPDKYAYEEVSSYDLPDADKLTFNIH